MRAGAEINQINDPPFQLHHSASVNACYNITTIASLFLLLPSGISHPTLASTQPTSSGLSKSVIINCVSPSLQLESIRHGTTVQSLPYAQSQGKAKQSEAKRSKAKRSEPAQHSATQRNANANAGTHDSRPAPPILSYYYYYWFQILSLSGSWSLASPLRWSGFVSAFFLLHTNNSDNSLVTIYLGIQ